MGEVEAFPEDRLQQICDVLAHPSSGLTGSEIGTYLLRLHIADPGPGVTRRARLFEALRGRQMKDRSGDAVAAFLEATLDPTRYAGNRPMFDARRREMNAVLAAFGLEVRDDGKLYPAGPSDTASAADDGRAQAALIAKELLDRVAQLSGLVGDGGDVVDRAFGGRGFGRVPVVAFVEPADDKSRAENGGLVALLKGVLAACTTVSLSAAELAELRGAAALLNRRLDAAVRLRPAARQPGAESRPELDH